MSYAKTIQQQTTIESVHVPLSTIGNWKEKMTNNLILMFKNHAMMAIHNVGHTHFNQSRRINYCNYLATILINIFQSEIFLSQSDEVQTIFGVT